ncbi:MAG: NAD-dependent epimerase/dehydratase family protein [Pirellulales bacterium]
MSAASEPKTDRSGVPRPAPGSPGSSRPFWRGRSVLVTGATGFVGGWLIRRLVDLEADVVCLIRDWSHQAPFSRSGFDRRTRMVWGDVRDQQLLERVLGEYEVATVLHLAAQAIVGVANRNPMSTFETNIGGTWSLLEACRRSPRVEQVVMASSDKAYGEQPDLPYSEATPLAGRHPYDVSKSCADLIGQSYAATYRLPVAITRCGNFFGGGDLSFNRIVPGTIRAILQGERPTIRSDGQFVRDYFYVEDGVEAYLLLAERLAECDTLQGEAFNFSHERPMTVLELVADILQRFDADLEPLVLGRANHEIRCQYLSAAKARDLLAWQPRFGFDEGMQRTVDWYREFYRQTDHDAAGHVRAELFQSAATAASASQRAPLEQETAPVAKSA